METDKLKLLRSGLLDRRIDLLTYIDMTKTLVEIINSKVLDIERRMVGETHLTDLEVEMGRDLLIETSERLLSSLSFPRKDGK